MIDNIQKCLTCQKPDCNNCRESTIDQSALREKRREYMHQYYLKHKEKNRKKALAYYRAHREEINRKKRERRLAANV